MVTNCRTDCRGSDRRSLFDTRSQCALSYFSRCFYPNIAWWPQSVKRSHRVRDLTLEVTKRSRCPPAVSHLTGRDPKETSFHQCLIPLLSCLCVVGTRGWDVRYGWRFEFCPGWHIVYRTNRLSPASHPPYPRCHEVVHILVTLLCRIKSRGWRCRSRRDRGYRDKAS